MCEASFLEMQACETRCMKRCMMVGVWDEVCEIKCRIEVCAGGGPDEYESAAPWPKMFSALTHCARLSSRSWGRWVQSEWSEVGALGEMGWVVWVEGDELRESRWVEWDELGGSWVRWVGGGELNELRCVRWVEWDELCEMSWATWVVWDELSEVSWKELVR